MASSEDGASPGDGREGGGDFLGGGGRRASGGGLGRGGGEVGRGRGAAGLGFGGGGGDRRGKALGGGGDFGWLAASDGGGGAWRAPAFGGAGAASTEKDGSGASSRWRFQKASRVVLALGVASAAATVTCARARGGGQRARSVPGSVRARTGVSACSKRSSTPSRHARSCILALEGRRTQQGRRKGRKVRKVRIEPQLLATTAL